MRRLWLDYQQQPPGYQWPGMLLLFIAFVLTGALIAYETSLSEKIDSQDQLVQKLKHLVVQQQSTATSPSTSPAMTEALTQQIHVGSSDHWEAFFAVLESAADESVTLVNISPDQRDITLNGEAKNLPSATEYAKRLQTTTLLTGVHITEYEIAKDHPQHPVRFTLVAQWHEATP